MFFFKVEKERREKELQEEKTRFLEARIGLHEARLEIVNCPTRQSLLLFIGSLH